jgi:hypothetical protein
LRVEVRLMQTPQLVAELTRLFAVEVDAVQAYGAAVALVGPGPIQDELEHQRHALLVQEQIVARGFRLPDVEPDVKGVVIGALTHPQRSLTVEDVLAGIRGNEQLTGTLYAKALARGLTGEARDVIARIRAEEHHHLAWVERALARRAWEAGQYANP